MTDFDDLLAANREFAATFDLGGFDGVAHAGVAVVTCMDSRIDPLGMIGLRPGDAKILRNPGGRVTDAALVALVLSANLLNVDRVLVVQHTRCAVASSSEAEIQERIHAEVGVDASWLSVGVISDQAKTLRGDVQRVRTHPLIPAGLKVGGFMYDVDSGCLELVAD